MENDLDQEEAAIDEDIAVNQAIAVAAQVVAVMADPRLLVAILAVLRFNED